MIGFLFDIFYYKEMCACKADGACQALKVGSKGIIETSRLAAFVARVAPCQAQGCRASGGFISCSALSKIEIYTLLVYHLD